MRKIILLALIFVAASCQQEKEQKTNQIVFSGKILNNSGKDLVLVNVNTHKNDSIHVDEEGYFRDTLKTNTLDSPIYLLMYGDVFTRIYLKQEQDLKMSFDLNDFGSTLSYAGKNKKQNRYFLSKSKIQKRFNSNGGEVFQFDEKEFKDHFKAKSQALKRNLDTVQLPRNFKLLEKRNLKYSYLASLLHYENNHARAIENSDFSTTMGFLDEIEQIQFTSGEDFLFSTSYRRLVDNHYKEKAKIIIDTDSLDQDIAYLTVVAGIKNDTIRNSLLYDKAKRDISYTDHLDLFYNIFMNASTNEGNNMEVKKDYKILEKLAKGRPSPEFERYENYKGGTTDLDDLLNNGYIYIDVWATWCGPCIKEIPDLKKIEKMYQNSNIKFVGISIDKKSDKEKWKKFIEDKDLEGVQLLADAEWDSEFIQKYLISGIPRFILLNPEGKIVRNNAPRPSDIELIKLFDELNI